MAQFVTHLQPTLADMHQHHQYHHDRGSHHPPTPPTPPISATKPRPPHHIELHKHSAESDGNTAFLRAARAGHLDKVLEHLKSNIDINTSNSNGLNALHLASKDGHINVVTELLKRGAVVDAATKKGNTALHIASLAGQEEVVKLLVANGAAVNVQSQNGFTPLYMAAQENHDNVVRFLLANGANQSLATEDGFTPLAVAMQQGHDKVVAVLLENDTRGKVRLPALHIAAKKDDCKAAALLLQNDHNPDVTSKSGFTPLHIAAHYGNESIANLLLNRGADVNYSAKHNITPLHVAAKWGKTNMVSLLLEKGANIESKTRDGLTPLHCAARSGHEQVVDMMLERGAPISSKTKNGLAPLHMASQGDHVDAARILLYHRAPVDEVTVDYLTALHVAAHCGHVRVAKLLLDRKADPNARALNGFTPLHIACKKNRIKVVELLLKHGASIEATTESGLTPLHVASFMGCMNIVIYLLQHDASPDVPTVRGETPLHLAARANQTDIIRILLRNGAQVDARAREQQTPLHIASRLGNVDIVMLLLQHGAAVDSTTKDMYTALHIAGKEGQEEVASVLLEHGGSLTATTKKGFTPLHLAAKYGNMKVAKLLLQRDAPVDAQGKNGVTPLHVASHYDHQNVALLLLDKGASPHATAKNGHTPLHIAARKNQMDIATTLLEYGAKADAESKAGFTPLHLSSQEGHTDMSTLLIEHQADTNHKAKNGLTPLHLCAQEDRVNVASVLVKNGAEVDSTTKAGYTPLHVASHFGQINMVRFLLQHGANVKACTSIGYTPLHQAAQQGHTSIVNLLLENSAPPNSLTNQGQTALSIAQKLGYISVVESLKTVTEPSIPTNVVLGAEEKYRVVAPETMQETFMSDSEDEGGEDTMLSDQPYRYLTVDEMKSLGDDSLPIDVTRDERMDSNRECMAPPTAVDDTISPQHAKESYAHFTATNYTPDNIDINRHPIHVGKLHWKNFLVSFLVDARGGAMRGCRHSGVRVIVPPRKAAMPMRVTCRYLKRDKLSHPPPLMEGEALASRILELGPVGAKFLGPVIIEVPHFGSLRGMEREIVILRSDNGETWREHTLEASEEAVHEVLNESFEGEELTALEDTGSGRMTRILTTDFPQYFAVVSRIRQEVHAIGPEGGMVSSSVVPQVQAVFPQGALTKKIKVGLQAQPISAELAAKLLGNRVAVSPIVTVEPRRRKFHKPITLTIPVPQAANKGMINQYSGDAPTLRLLCSITGGTTRAQWEDVTGSTPLTFVNDCVSFTTTVSARFWLMDCRNIGEATKMATELYKEAIHVPFMAKFVVFAKRVDILEARLRVFCMTDDKEDKTLEHQEHFTEVAKSRDVEVLEGKPQYIEFAGNLVPVTKSGDQLQLGFRAFRENRLPFTVRVKDPHADTVGRILFMREPKVAKGEPPQQPICILNIVLPETILPESVLSESDLSVLNKKYSFLRDSGLGRLDTTCQRTDLRLSDISNLLGEDWVPLASELGITNSDVNLVKSECPSSVAQQAMAMLRLWLQQDGNKATGYVLEAALHKIGRDDIVQQCIFNVDEVDRAVHLDQSGFESLKEELGPSRDASLRRDASLDITYDEQDIMKESESVEELVEAEKKEPYEDRLSKSVISKDKHERDIDETKYIGEEKFVEEERKTVAQLKEIFAQDKRDRQYERQPPISEKLPTAPPVNPKKEKVSPQSMLEDICKVSATEDSIEGTPSVQEEVSLICKSTNEGGISTLEKDISKKQPSPPPSVRTEADQRRDSELFQGVTEELVRLETTCKVIPAAEELMSPKVSKTPPPSPAELKDSTGAAAWQQGDILTTTEKPLPAEEWTEKSQEKEKHTHATLSDWMLSTPTSSAAVEGSGCLGPQCMKISHPCVVSSMKLVPSVEPPQISGNLCVSVGSSETPLNTHSEKKCEFQLLTPPYQNHDSETMEQVDIVKELPPAIDTESDSSVKTETFNITFSKEVPLGVTSEARNHRSSVHMQPEFGIIQFFPEIVPRQSIDLLNTTPSRSPVEGCMHRRVSEFDSLLSQVHTGASEPLIEPKMTIQTNSPLMQLTEVLPNQDTRLVASQVESKDKPVSDIVNPENLALLPKDLQIVASSSTSTTVTKGGAHLNELETTVEQILSEISMQEKVLDEASKFVFHSELKNEVQAAPILKTHVNVFSVLPHEEAVIELLPRKWAGNICNEVEAKSKQGTDSNVHENSTDYIDVCNAVQEADLIRHFVEPESTVKLDEKSVVSCTPVPHSVKQRDATKHGNISEDRIYPLYDYKWPDEIFAQVVDDTILPMSSGHLESKSSRDSEWVNKLPIDSVMQISDSSEESECMAWSKNLSTDQFKFSCAPSDRDSLKITNHARKFDNDIQANVFDEVNPRHSLHELEETVSQLISEVEMDESQLLRNLSCFGSPVVKHSHSSEDVVLQSDDLDPQKTISNAETPHSESFQKQEPFEDSRPIRAEVKVLVKTSDTGKEVIEIHSRREYLDTEVTPGQEGSPSVFGADLKSSMEMLENFQEQQNFPQNVELSEKHVPLQLAQSSSGFRIDKNIQLSHELLQNDMPSRNISQSVQIGSDLSKNVEYVPLVHDQNQAYSSVLPEHQQHPIQKLFVLPPDRLLDDTPVHKPKMYMERQKLHFQEGNKQQALCYEDQQHEQYRSGKQSHRCRQQQKTEQQLSAFESHNFEIKIEDNKENAKFFPELQNIKCIEKVKEPQKVCEIGTDGKCHQILVHQKSVLEQTQIFQDHKEEEKFQKTHPGGQHRKHGRNPKQEEKRQDGQFHHIQRLFIRSPDFTLSEPLNMLSLERSKKQHSVAVKEQSQHIKKLLVRSADFEDCITFPIVKSLSSSPTKLHSLSFTPSPPPQQLPKTKLFENLSKTPLVSEEDLHSVSPLKHNSPPQNLFFSFMPMDNVSDVTDGLNTYTPFARWSSMPSLVMEPVCPSSSTIFLNGTTVSSCLMRVVSMPSLQDSIPPLHTRHNESCLSSSHSTDEGPKDGSTLINDGDETPLIMQNFSNANHTSSPLSLPLPTFTRPHTQMSFWQQNSSSPLSPGFSGRHCDKTFFSSHSSSFSSHHNEAATPYRSAICSRQFPDVFKSISSRYLPNPVVNPLHKSPGTIRKHRQNHTSCANTITGSQPPSSNMQGILDPWYLQTDFLLSPVVIPSGYCTWVPTPDQQIYSRGKEGSDFKISVCRPISFSDNNLTK